jgi:NAD(P)-dependent dehydrogenase (short-subunit alcohol dehydrogenase family)
MKNDAYVITGPTSGIGREAARQLAGRGTLVLVGRNRAKLERVSRQLGQRGALVHTVVADMAEPTDVLRAAKEIRGLKLSLVGLVNNAGIRETGTPTQNSLGWDKTFATNHVGPFLLTEALADNLAEGARVLSVVSAVEDPGRGPAVAAGFRGGRYLSAQGCARGEWVPGGATRPGADAYATSKQALLAATLKWARQHPRLKINALEPGLNPLTGLGGSHPGLRVAQLLVFPWLMVLLRPFLPILTTPRQAGRVITRLITDPKAPTGTYFDERGRPMRGSDRAHDPEFGRLVVLETRALVSGGTPTAR